MNKNISDLPFNEAWQIAEQKEYPNLLPNDLTVIRYMAIHPEKGRSTIVQMLNKMAREGKLTIVRCKTSHGAYINAYRIPEPLTVTTDPCIVIKSVPPKSKKE